MQEGDDTDNKRDHKDRCGYSDHFKPVLHQENSDSPLVRKIQDQGSQHW